MSESKGLTSAEVNERIAEGQVNQVRRSHFAEYRDIVFRNVFTLFNGLVVPAAVALFQLNEYRAAFAVSGLAVINTVVGLGQELRAKRHLDQLTLLVDQGRHRPAPCANGCGHFVDVGLGVKPGIICVGYQPLDRPALDLVGRPRTCRAGLRQL